ncbi:hypothetical protein L873DRAFT_1819111 [Choiromyces venosus 120613-1]|uniref:Uncharacterized protein n=1 Tax=Choiromyces venosus 120613-1 TaxID=1336337 RepID=A0A3N4IZL2_9PEZI|nr:hypothetical protein L873DRAFT_1819111 [Choiromyces venosus 120613-1]
MLVRDGEGAPSPNIHNLSDILQNPKQSTDPSLTPVWLSIYLLSQPRTSHLLRSNLISKKQTPEPHSQSPT